MKKILFVLLTASFILYGCGEASEVNYESLSKYVISPETAGKVGGNIEFVAEVKTESGYLEFTDGSKTEDRFIEVSLKRGGSFLVSVENIENRDDFKEGDIIKVTGKFKEEFDALGGPAGVKKEKIANLEAETIEAYKPEKTVKDAKVCGNIQGKGDVVIDDVITHTSGEGKYADTFIIVYYTYTASKGDDTVSLGLQDLGIELFIDDDSYSESPEITDYPDNSEAIAKVDADGYTVEFQLKDSVTSINEGDEFKLAALYGAKIDWSLAKLYAEDDQFNAICSMEYTNN